LFFLPLPSGFSTRKTPWISRGQNCFPVFHAPYKNKNLFYYIYYYFGLCLSTMSEQFRLSLQGKTTKEVPFWFMRQAGRYLPEYQAIRQNFSNFLEFCYTPDAACEVTLQPLRRYDMDAAILFCDILVIPDALGQPVGFVKGEGPKLDPLFTAFDMAKLDLSRIREHLSPVQESIKLIRAALPENKTLIGFSGAPWTLACYMLEGQGSKEFSAARTLLYKEPATYQALTAILEKAITEYLCMQAEAGAQVVKLFDSWAGVLDEGGFETAVLQPAKRIIAAFKAKHPEVPVIAFARGAGAKLARYAKESGADCVAFDQTMPVSEAVKCGICIQGNLDNHVLLADANAAVAETKRILETVGQHPFIFNLGHGVMQHTPPEHVAAVAETIKAFRR
jgi:uroporphyrinogen decarboxylase